VGAWGFQTLQIELENAADGYIQLFDIEGRLVREVYSGTFQVGITRFVIDISDLSHGNYVYKVVIDNQLQSINIIK
jgi:hypothetical protein